MEHNKYSFVIHVLRYPVRVLFLCFLHTKKKGSILVEATFVFEYGLGSNTSFICSDFKFTTILSNAINGSPLKHIANNDSLYQFSVCGTAEIESICVPNDIGSEKFCRWLVITCRCSLKFQRCKQRTRCKNFFVY